MAREKTTSNLTAVMVTTFGRATRAKNDEQLLESWLKRDIEPDTIQWWAPLSLRCTSLARSVVA